MLLCKYNANFKGIFFLAVNEYNLFSHLDLAKFKTALAASVADPFMMKLRRVVEHDTMDIDLTQRFSFIFRYYMSFQNIGEDAIVLCKED